ncbi:hypothetical protein JX265_001805 [Neoarthrinium moseri]|uniref:Uncharacterized protein n=1 Tax=Neoarthrinium moseri TaxID=1658444 RepID=A0A9Q0AR10_9PEZI|nr:hypothetical protein JX265_001805 [Neoarthrinium moseri]
MLQGQAEAARTSANPPMDDSPRRSIMVSPGIARDRTRGIPPKEPELNIWSLASDHVKHHNHRSQSPIGSGFDGPPTPLSDEAGCSGSDLVSHSSAQTEHIPGHYIPTEAGSEMLGSVDWQKSWFKHKPRRAHNVSEVTAPDPTVHKHAVDLFSMAGFEDESSEEDAGKVTICPLVDQHHARFHAIQAFALKSCPELHRMIGSDDEGITHSPRSSTARRDLVPRSFGFRSQPRATARNAISRRLRSLGRRFRRSSSNYSIRSDFPVPPNAKERRLLSRDSADIYPSSGEESPMFNTPASGVTPLDFPVQPGSLLDLASELALSSEDPKQSYRADQSQVPAVGKDTENQPSALDPCYASPSPPYSSSSNASPLSQPQRHRQRRGKARRSRLSEVTTPDDLRTQDNTAQLNDTPSSPIDDSAIIESEDDEFDEAYPKPMVINRARNDTSQLQHSSRTDPVSPCGQEEDVSVLLPLRETTKLTNTGFSLDRRLLESKDKEGIPERSFSVGKPCRAASLRAKDTSSISCRTESALNLDRSSPSASRSDSPLVVASEPAQVAPVPVHLGSKASPYQGAGVSEAITPPSLKTSSCHPDTWNTSQGEPGDSDPFCPPECDSRHSHETILSDSRPTRMFRQSTSGTVVVLDCVESSGSEGNAGGDKESTLGGDHERVLLG